jgi:DNA-nicking Smr family endonuclease
MVGSEETLSFRRTGVQERVLSKLRNGHFVIDAELDLHGMTIPVAQQALSAFLSECQQYRIRHARIIHGKGWGSKDHKPVIKTWLNGWLRELDDVLAFCSARVEDGGTGAVYLLLRKPKEPTST